MNTSRSRVEQLRQLMHEQGIDLYIMENLDPHETEYLPDHWQEIRWLSGFRGDVATVVITAEDALLWTDSRFFISGAEQLAGTPFQLMKMKVPGVPSPIEWINNYELEFEKKCSIGGDRRLLSNLYQMARIDQNLVDILWTDRPELPKGTIEIYPEQYSGEPTQERIDRVLKAIERQGDPGIWIKELDQIAWVLNLRGSDILCTPTFVSYLYLARTGSTLYIDECKVSSDVRKYLKDLKIGIRPYAEAETSKHSNCICDSPIPLMKAIKNPVEIDGYRSAMLRDGIALSRFYHWLEQQPAGTVTEMQCVQRLIDFRSEQPLYRQESFPAIVAWREHAALPHYEPSAEHDTLITGDGLLLIDTGGQYLDGTTDITRTIGIGQVTPEMKRDFTLVLKGHIRLATAVFPRGTRGDQLDVLARIDLWRDGKTYRHGTSHGVGHYLGVHEGPESVRMEHNPQVLFDGMVFSNEPAIYLPGQYGIRHESCVLVRPFDVGTEAIGSTPCNQTEQGEFQALDTLTLYPIDTSCIDFSMLNAEELVWIDTYNRKCYQEIAPHLNESDRKWLENKCKTAVQ